MVTVSSSTFVGAIIQNQKGELLLQKRDSKPHNFPSSWTLFGGKMEKQETSKQAILRELEEEIHLRKKCIKSIKMFKTYKQKNGVNQIIFLIKTNASLTDLVLLEGEKMEFVKREKLFKRKFAFNISEVLKDFTKRILQKDPQDLF